MVAKYGEADRGRILKVPVVGEGFKKVDPDRWEFAHEEFLSGQKHLLKHINRRKSSNINNQQQQSQAQQTTSVGACVEVGKFGLEEEMERLKRDKNVLMQELVRLRQQQQASDHQLQTLGQRLQGMEQRQQQMVSFLAKAMQNRGFLAQLVQQQKESIRHFAGVNKKRRLPEQENSSNSQNAESPDGQIIKYQPLKINTSHMLETNTSPECMHINDGPYVYDVLDTGSSTNTTSLETPPSDDICEIQSSPALVTKSQLPESHVCPKIGDGGYNFSMSDNVDGIIESKIFSPVRDVDVLLEEMSKLPSMYDAYWEDLIPIDQPSGILDEINLNTSVGFANEKVQAEHVIGSDDCNNMDQLTEQMGILTSEKNAR
ncbi:hypothetical protein GIB67_038710 [Kingdonia uniflora]|uniref:Uncharacterized protein n=1 Tax=Kingdonia uniflora TaxID=39325 RepID=A0A7J7NSJ7_9MAGN|nr:hypothetical protein GIB67_038710 [Kingdonia uniflora]